jgi:hypothetical protein
VSLSDLAQNAAELQHFRGLTDADDLRKVRRV